MAKKFKDLTKEEKEMICNGCGGKGGFIDPPDFIFHDSCNQHDYNYFLGFKEAHRKKADKQFYAHMKDRIQDIKAIYYPFSPTIARYKMWAWIYYKAVRLCGKKFFHYGLQEQEFKLNTAIQDTL